MGRLDFSFGRRGVSRITRGAWRSEEDAFASPVAVAVFERDGGGLDRNFGGDGVVLIPDFGR